MAVPGVHAVGLTLVATPTESGHLVLQEAGGDQESHLDGQGFQRVLHQSEQFVPIQGQLDLSQGFSRLGPMLGLLPLVRRPPLRIGSFQGGSSSSLREKRTSSLATGREETPLSLFNYDRDTLLFGTDTHSTAERIS
jgi:hypothetical protein